MAVEIDAKRLAVTGAIAIVVVAGIVYLSTRGPSKGPPRSEKNPSQQPPDDEPGGARAQPHPSTGTTRLDEPGNKPRGPLERRLLDTIASRKAALKALSRLAVPRELSVSISQPSNPAFFPGPRGSLADRLKLDWQFLKGQGFDVVQAGSIHVRDYHWPVASFAQRHERLVQRLKSRKPPYVARGEACDGGLVPFFYLHSQKIGLGGRTSSLIIVAWWDVMEGKRILWRSNEVRGTSGNAMAEHRAATGLAMADAVSRSKPTLKRIKKDRYWDRFWPSREADPVKRMLAGDVLGGEAGYYAEMVARGLPKGGLEAGEGQENASLAALRYLLSISSDQTLRDLVREGTTPKVKKLASAELAHRGISVAPDSP